ncbi:MAG: PKD domain-containing protein [Crocinitomicaceae bacterium]|nr:PKD domain-containing protein [Crocinitomicaceae bacterium]
MKKVIKKIKKLQATLFIFSFSLFGFSQETYTTPGTYTWTVPPCVNEITVKVWGGGGGGGGALAIMRNSGSGGETCSGAAGGGGGGFTMKTFPVTPGQTYTIVVGAGGTAGIAGAGSWNGGITTPAGNGGTGGTSSFTGNGQNLNATGGTGGGGASGYNTTTSATDLNTVGTGGTGGVGTGGTANYTGGNGGGGYIAGNFSNDFSGPGGGAAGPGGNGGSNLPPFSAVVNPPGGAGQAPGGNGAAGRYNNQPGKQEKPGNNGLAYGGGGGGAIAHIDPYNVAKAAGGSGADGAVIIEYTTSGTPTPTPTISSTPATCSAAGTSQISNYVAGTTYTFTPTGPTVGTGGAISGMTTGTSYTVTATASGACESSASSSFSNNPKLAPPTVTVTPDLSVCENDAVTLTASGASTYTWSPTTGLTPTTGATVSASPSATTTYTVTGTAANGCTGTAQVTVTVTPAPTVNAGSDANIPCGGSANIGEEITTTPTNPDYTLTAPACTHPGRYMSGSLTQGGGIYNNGVTTTGGTVNINNTNTLVDVGHIDPLGPNAWSTLWYSDFTNQFVEVCAGQTFYININAISLYNNPPYQCRIWIDWNNDGAFDASEVVYTSPLLTSSPINLTNVPIQVPAGQAYGGFRMRIRFKDNSPFVASDNSCTYGNPNGTVAPYGGYTGSGSGYNYMSDEIEEYSVHVNCGNGNPSGGGDLSFGWSPPEGLDDTTIPNPTATPTQTTTYTVTVTDNATGCTATDQVTITVPQDNATFDPIGPLCSGTTAPTLPTTSTNGINGTWNPSTVSNTASGSYTFTPTGGQCANPVTINVVVNQNPTYTSTSVEPSCGNSDGQLVLTPSGGGAPYSYVVNGATYTNGTISNLTDGTYNFTITDNNGCSVTGSETLMNSSGDDPSFSLTNYCEGAANSASGIATPGGVFSFDPAVSDGATIDPTTGTISNGVGGTTYTVKYSLSGACPTSSTQQVTVNPNPIYTTSLTNPSCGNPDGAISITVTTGTAPYNYTVNGTTQSNGSFTNLTDGAYTIVIDDANGCSTSSSETLTNTTGVTPSFTLTDFCEGATNAATAISPTGGVFSFNPMVSDGATINASTGAISNGVGGTTYTVEYSTGGTCPGSSTQLITVNPNPIFTLSSNNPTCGTSDGSIILSGLTATSYTISYTDQNGALVGPTNTGLNGAGQIELNNLGAGSYSNFTVSVASTGCSYTNPNVVQLVEPNAPVVMAPNDISVCMGDSITLTASNPDNAIISWSGGVQDGVIFQPSGSAIFTVTATLNGCISTAQVQVTVNPLPIIDAGVNASICANASTTITASGGVSYAWDNGLGAGSSKTVSPISTTTYTVVGTDINGCINSDDVTVTVTPVPGVNIEGINLTGCAPVVPTLTNTLASGADNCQWILGDGRTYNGCSISPTFTKDGCYDVTLIVTSSFGCTSSQTINDYVCVTPSPVASFYATPYVISDYPWETQMHNNSSNATNYTWYFGDGSAPNNEFEPSHQYPEDVSGGYPIMLIASNDIGCVDTAYYAVKVLEPLIFYVPNTFTPDGDQFNNTFFPIFTSGYDIYNYEMLIFDRWGEIVFETHNTEVGWDGTYNGKMVQDGTYTWKIVVKIKDYDEFKQFVGHVNIIR